MTDVVAMGESLGLYRGEGIGPLAPGAPATFSFAGAESNVSIGLARLGHQVAMAGRVGDDMIGRVITDQLRAEGVSLSGLVTDPGAPTAFMLRHNRTADRVIASYYRQGSAGSRLRAGDIDDDLIRSARILHTTGITVGISPSAREAVEHAIRVARDAGVTVSLDVNYRARLWSREDAGAALRSVLRSVDVVFGGEEELQMLPGGSGVPRAPGAPGAPGAADAAGIAAAVRDLGPAEVVVKRGSLGALALAGTGAGAGAEVVEVPAVPVTAVDPVGAGDAFVAGYLSARLEGHDVAGRLRRGALCGSFAVSVPGDWEGLPRRDELHLLSGTENVHR